MLLETSATQISVTSLKLFCQTPALKILRSSRFCATKVIIMRASTVVFDKVTDLDGVPDGYRAMNEREALKVMIAF